MLHPRWLYVPRSLSVREGGVLTNGRSVNQACYGAHALLLERLLWRGDGRELPTAYQERGASDPAPDRSAESYARRRLAPTSGTAHDRPDHDSEEECPWRRPLEAAATNTS